MTAGTSTPGPAPIGAAPARENHTGYNNRDAIRLLFILALGSEPVDPARAGPGDQRVFRGEKRAMAMDFLVRYPDYLADALLDRYETEGDPSLLAQAEAIFDADEPSERLVGMVRWHRGAFQNIETALSILRAYGMVTPFRQTSGQRRHDFRIEPAAFPFMEDVIRQHPSLAWYRDRAGLVSTLAGLRSGSSLKDDQYLHQEYRDAPLGTEIPSIKDRVLARIRRLRAEA